MTFEDARAAFPVLERYAYLNAGSVGPLAQRTHDTLAAAERDELVHGRATWRYLDRMLEARGRLRAALAAEIGVETELMSLTTSTTEGCRIVLAGLELGPDDEIVTTDAEHFGLLGPVHLSGARVRVAALRDRPAAESLEAILAEVGPLTKLVAVSHVLWVNGHVLPMDELRDAVSVPILVDGAQSVGAIPVDAAPFDFYTVSGQKWLCGPAPSGGLYVKDPDRLSVALPSYFSQAKYESDGRFDPRDGAQRFDPGWIPLPYLEALLAALDEPPEWRFERSRQTAERCRELLLERGCDVVTEPGHSNLVSWRWEGDTRAAALALGEDGVLIRDLPGTGLLRASCGYWTSEGDLTRLVESLAGSSR
ncbi:MAG TPA: aminotransferase class V-fold PLP-dependent enzyme [Gaiellaceae bacterium]|nr:aminotransferase class V-fold PLP-dependent enzyme [Gaiellaceae bacterium]